MITGIETSAPVVVCRDILESQCPMKGGDVVDDESPALAFSTRSDNQHRSAATVTGVVVVSDFS